MHQKLIEKVLADMGIPIDPPSRSRRARDLISHALGGCRPVPLTRFDPASHRLVEVGLICAVCLRNCDYPEGRIE